MFDFAKGKKRYWQALLSRRALLDKGCKRIPSGKLVAFYNALLRHPKPGDLPADLREVQYKRILEALDEGRKPDAADLVRVNGCAVPKCLEDHMSPVWYFC